MNDNKDKDIQNSEYKIIADMEEQEATALSNKLKLAVKICIPCVLVMVVGMSVYSMRNKSPANLPTEPIAPIENSSDIAPTPTVTPTATPVATPAPTPTATPDEGWVVTEETADGKFMTNSKGETAFVGVDKSTPKPKNEALLDEPIDTEQYWVATGTGILVNTYTGETKPDPNHYSDGVNEEVYQIEGDGQLSGNKVGIMG